MDLSVLYADTPSLRSLLKKILINDQYRPIFRGVSLEKESELSPQLDHELGDLLCTLIHDLNGDEECNLDEIGIQANHFMASGVPRDVLSTSSRSIPPHIQKELALLWRTLSIMRFSALPGVMRVFFKQLLETINRLPALSLSAYWGSDNEERKSGIHSPSGKTVDSKILKSAGSVVGIPFDGELINSSGRDAMKHIANHSNSPASAILNLPELKYLSGLAEDPSKLDDRHDPLGIVQKLLDTAESCVFAAQPSERGDLLSVCLSLAVKSGRVSLICQIATLLLAEDDHEYSDVDIAPLNEIINCILSVGKSPNKALLVDAQAPQGSPAGNGKHRIRSILQNRRGKDGMLLTFGKSDHGKLGHGDTQLHRLIPTIVESMRLISVVKIASMSTCALAVDQKGAVYIWGIGCNSMNASCTKADIRPAILDAISSKLCVIDVSCGLGHALFLIKSGRVYAWGNGGNGRLGLGDANDRSEACLVQALQAEKIRSIQCGASHSLALSQTGSVYCWGKNTQGQCGLGHADENVLLPSMVKSLDAIKARVIEIAAGWEHSAALTSDGKIFTWGCGYKDSRRGVIPPVLGLGHNEGRPNPHMVPSLAALKIIRIACGWDHCLALVEDGRVLSWGSGQNGKLGHGAEENVAIPSVISALCGLRIVFISAGCEHSAAITDTGVLLTWGHGDGGRLGLGDNNPSLVPAEVSAVKLENSQPFDVHCGDKFTMVLVNNHLNEQFTPLFIHNESNISAGREYSEAWLHSQCDITIAYSIDATVDAKQAHPLPHQRKVLSRHRVGECLLSLSARACETGLDANAVSLSSTSANERAYAIECSPATFGYLLTLLDMQASSFSVGVGNTDLHTDFETMAGSDRLPSDERKSEDVTHAMHSTKYSAQSEPADVGKLLRSSYGPLLCALTLIKSNLDALIAQITTINQASNSKRGESDGRKASSRGSDASNEHFEDVPLLDEKANLQDDEFPGDDDVEARDLTATVDFLRLQERADTSDVLDRTGAIILGAGNQGGLLDPDRSLPMLNPSAGPLIEAGAGLNPVDNTVNFSAQVHDFMQSRSLDERAALDQSGEYFLRQEIPIPRTTHGVPGFRIGSAGPVRDTPRSSRSAGNTGTTELPTEDFIRHFIGDDGENDVLGGEVTPRSLDNTPPPIEDNENSQFTLSLGVSQSDMLDVSVSAHGEPFNRLEHRISEDFSRGADVPDNLHEEYSFMNEEKQNPISEKSAVGLGLNREDVVEGSLAGSLESFVTDSSTDIDSDFEHFEDSALQSAILSSMEMPTSGNYEKLVIRRFRNCVNEVQFTLPRILHSANQLAAFCYNLLSGSDIFDGSRRFAVESIWLKLQPVICSAQNLLQNQRERNVLLCSLLRSTRINMYRLPGLTESLLRDRELGGILLSEMCSFGGERSKLSGDTLLTINDVAEFLTSYKDGHFENLKLPSACGQAVQTNINCLVRALLCVCIEHFPKEPETSSASINTVMRAFAESIRFDLEKSAKKTPSSYELEMSFTGVVLPLICSVFSKGASVASVTLFYPHILQILVYCTSILSSTQSIEHQTFFEWLSIKTRWVILSISSSAKLLLNPMAQLRESTMRSHLYELSDILDVRRIADSCHDVKVTASEMLRPEQAAWLQMTRIVHGLDSSVNAYEETKILWDVSAKTLSQSLYHVDAIFSAAFSEYEQLSTIETWGSVLPQADDKTSFIHSILSAVFPSSDVLTASKEKGSSTALSTKTLSRSNFATTNHPPQSDFDFALRVRLLILAIMLKANKLHNSIDALSHEQNAAASFKTDSDRGLYLATWFNSVCICVSIVTLVSPLDALARREELSRISARCELLLELPLASMSTFVLDPKHFSLKADHKTRLATFQATFKSILERTVEVVPISRFSKRETSSSGIDIILGAKCCEVSEKKDEIINFILLLSETTPLNYIIRHVLWEEICFRSACVAVSLVQKIYILLAPLEKAKMYFSEALQLFYSDDELTCLTTCLDRPAQPTHRPLLRTIDNLQGAVDLLDEEFARQIKDHPGDYGMFYSYLTALQATFAAASLCIKRNIRSFNVCTTHVLEVPYKAFAMSISRYVDAIEGKSPSTAFNIRRLFVDKLRVFIPYRGVFALDGIHRRLKMQYTNILPNVCKMLDPVSAQLAPAFDSLQILAASLRKKETFLLSPGLKNLEKTSPGIVSSVFTPTGDYTIGFWIWIPTSYTQKADGFDKSVHILSRIPETGEYNLVHLLNNQPLTCERNPSITIKTEKGSAQLFVGAILQDLSGSVDGPSKKSVELTMKSGSLPTDKWIHFALSSSTVVLDAAFSAGITKPKTYIKLFMDGKELDHVETVGARSPLHQNLIIGSLPLELGRHVERNGLILSDVYWIPTGCTSEQAEPLNGYALTSPVTLILEDIDFLLQLSCNLLELIMSCTAMAAASASPIPNNILSLLPAICKFSFEVLCVGSEKAQNMSIRTLRSVIEFVPRVMSLDQVDIVIDGKDSVDKFPGELTSSLIRTPERARALSGVGTPDASPGSSSTPIPVGSARNAAQARKAKLALQTALGDLLSVANMLLNHGEASEISSTFRNNYAKRVLDMRFFAHSSVQFSFGQEYASYEWDARFKLNARLIVNGVVSILAGALTKRIIDPNVFGISKRMLSLSAQSQNQETAFSMIALLCAGGLPQPLLTKSRGCTEPSPYHSEYDLKSATSVMHRQHSALFPSLATVTDSNISYGINLKLAGITVLPPETRGGVEYKDSLLLSSLSIKAVRSSLDTFILPDTTDSVVAHFADTMQASPHFTLVPLNAISESVSAFEVPTLLELTSKLEQISPKKTFNSKRDLTSNKLPAKASRMKPTNPNMEFFEVMTYLRCLLLQSSDSHDLENQDQRKTVISVLSKCLPNIISISKGSIHDINSAMITSESSLKQRGQFALLRAVLEQGDVPFLEHISQQWLGCANIYNSDIHDNVNEQPCVTMTPMLGDVQILRNKIRALTHFPSVKLQGTVLKPMSGRWFYECCLLSEGLMQIGWADEHYRCDPVCGQGVGDHAHSWAYDGLRTKKWNVSCETYGKRWHAGDMVGVLLDSDLMEMRYFINGEDLGPAFCNFSAGNIFPALSLNVRQCVRVNFGQHKFTFPPDEIDGKPFRPVNESLRNLKARKKDRSLLIPNESLGGVDENALISDDEADDANDGVENKDEVDQQIWRQAIERSSLRMQDYSANMDSDALLNRGETQDVAQLRRQVLIENLIGMGFPVDWALRGAENCESSTSESAVIAWIIERMELEQSRLDEYDVEDSSRLEDQEEKDEDREEEEYMQQNRERFLDQDDQEADRDEDRDEEDVYPYHFQEHDQEYDVDQEQEEQDDDPDQEGRVRDQGDDQQVQIDRAYLLLAGDGQNQSAEQLSAHAPDRGVRPSIHDQELELDLEADRVHERGHESDQGREREPSPVEHPMRDLERVPFYGRILADDEANDEGRTQQRISGDVEHIPDTIFQTAYDSSQSGLSSANAPTAAALLREGNILHADMVSTLHASGAEMKALSESNDRAIIGGSDKDFAANDRMNADGSAWHFEISYPPFLLGELNVRARELEKEEFLLQFEDMTNEEIAITSACVQYSLCILYARGIVFNSLNLQSDGYKLSSTQISDLLPSKTPDVPQFPSFTSEPDAPATSNLSIHSCLMIDTPFEDLMKFLELSFLSSLSSAQQSGHIFPIPNGGLRLAAFPPFPPFTCSKDGEFDQILRTLEVSQMGSALFLASHENNAYTLESIRNFISFLVSHASHSDPNPQKIAFACRSFVEFAITECVAHIEAASGSDYDNWDWILNRKVATEFKPNDNEKSKVNDMTSKPALIWAVYFLRALLTSKGYASTYASNPLIFNRLLQFCSSPNISFKLCIFDVCALILANLNKTADSKRYPEGQYSKLIAECYLSVAKEKQLMQAFSIRLRMESVHRCLHSQYSRALLAFLTQWQMIQRHSCINERSAAEALISIDWKCARRKGDDYIGVLQTTPTSIKVKWDLSNHFRSPITEGSLMQLFIVAGAITCSERPLHCANIGVSSGVLNIDYLSPDTLYRVFVRTRLRSNSSMVIPPDVSDISPKDVRDATTEIAAKSDSKLAVEDTSVKTHEYLPLSPDLISTFIATDSEPLFLLSKQNMSANLQLSRGSLTLRNTANKRWSTARASVKMVKGIHRWDVHIDRCISKNIFLGVVNLEARIDNYVGCDRYGWAFLANKAIWHNKSKLGTYGELFRTGDTVSIVLNLDCGTMSFSLNGNDLGVAVEGLTGPLYPAFSLYNEDDQLTIFPHRFENSQIEKSISDGVRSTTWNARSNVGEGTIDRIETCRYLHNFITTQGVENSPASNVAYSLYLRYKLWSEHGVGIRSVAFANGYASILVSEEHCNDVFISSKGHFFPGQEILLEGVAATVLGASCHKIWFQFQVTNEVVCYSADSLSTLCDTEDLVFKDAISRPTVSTRAPSSEVADDSSGVSTYESVLAALTFQRTVWSLANDQTLIEWLELLASQVGVHPLNLSADNVRDGLRTFIETDIRRSTSEGSSNGVATFKASRIGKMASLLRSQSRQDIMLRAALMLHVNDVFHPMFSLLHPDDCSSPHNESSLMLEMRGVFFSVSKAEFVCRLAIPFGGISNSTPILKGKGEICATFKDETAEDSNRNLEHKSASVGVRSDEHDTIQDSDKKESLEAITLYVENEGAISNRLLAEARLSGSEADILILSDPHWRLLAGFQCSYAGQLQSHFQRISQGASDDSSAFASLRSKCSFSIFSPIGEINRRCAHSKDDLSFCVREKNAAAGNVKILSGIDNEPTRLFRLFSLMASASRIVSDRELLNAFMEEACLQAERLFSNVTGLGRNDGTKIKKMDPINAGDLSLLLQYLHALGATIGIGIRLDAPCFIRLPGIFHSVLVGADEASINFGGLVAVKISAYELQLNACAYAFRRGLISVLPKESLQFLNQDDIAYLLNGCPRLISTSFVRRNALYEPGTSCSDAHIVLFWAALDSLSHDSLVLLWLHLWRDFGLTSFDLHASLSEEDFLSCPKVRIFPLEEHAFPSADAAAIFLLPDRFGIIVPKYSSVAILMCRLHELIASIR